MTEDWLGRWQQGRIGWHQAEGNPYLQRYWPRLEQGSTVLVPLCGKSVDMVWLAEQGLNVRGIELSEIAILDFFAENNLDYVLGQEGSMDCYVATSLPLHLYCGDYFDYKADLAGALYDRGALATWPATERPRYIEHTRSLLSPEAYRMIITLEYDQDVVQGPPFSVLPAEMQQYWPDLQRVATHNDIENSPPKFRQAGLDEFVEAVWSSA
jgi:thiopurine S-methyltransferase